MPPPSKRNSSSRRQPTPRKSTPQSTSKLSGASDLIDPRWILKALAIVLAVALLCAWGTLCLLWYQGQWQLVLHPSRTIATTPNQFLFPGGEREDRFFDDATGQPQLSGWLLPDWQSGASGTQMLTWNNNVPTVLFLHGADGNMSDALPRAYTLHRIRLNVLLFDYRGYGHSVGRHPTQATMQQDAAAALDFLINRQGVKPAQIILYGQGIGASLAVNLAAQHHDIPAIILDTPDGDLTNRVIRDPRSSLVPARLLFNEPFPLAEPLSKLATPKLLISYTSSTPAALANAADPKTTIELPSLNDSALAPAIQRFVDLYLRTSLPAPYPEVHPAQPIPHTYPSQ